MFNTRTLTHHDGLISLATKLILKDNDLLSEMAPIICYGRQARPSLPLGPRERGSFRTEKKKAAMKRAVEKKRRKKLSMPYPLGLPPDLHRSRAIVYHRLPGRRHVTHAHANILYSAAQTSVCVCVYVLKTLKRQDLHGFR